MAKGGREAEEAEEAEGQERYGSIFVRPSFPTSLGSACCGEASVDQIPRIASHRIGLYCIAAPLKLCAPSNASSRFLRLPCLRIRAAPPQAHLPSFRLDSPCLLPPASHHPSSSSSAACASLLREVAAIMRWHRGQQMWLAVASVVPGWLVYQQTIKPVYAALLLVCLYFLSKRHAFLVQRQFERDEHDRKVREAEEKQRLVSLPTRKRRAIERAKRRQEEVGASEDSGSDHKDE